MKKIITAFLLVLSFVFSALSLTACGFVDAFIQKESVDENSGTSDGTGNNQGNKLPSQEDMKAPMSVQEMLEGKYSDFEIPREKLEGALAEALKKIDYAMPTFSGNNFPSHNSVDNVYSVDSNLQGGSGGWNTGFWTGILWHAYELTGDSKYKLTANGQVPSFAERIENKIGVNHHDMGFLYTPSCVAAYKLDGNIEAKNAAIMAADQSRLFGTLLKCGDTVAGEYLPVRTAVVS